MENMIIYLRTLAIILSTLSCKLNEDVVKEERLVGAYLYSIVTIGVKDKSGKDLLDPSLPNSLRYFKVYYLKKGVKQFYFDSWMDASGGYRIEKYASKPWYHLQVFIDNPGWDVKKTGDWTTTYLEFEDGSTDTIRAQFTIRPGLLIIDRASYNGVTFFDRFQDYSDEPTYQVIK